MRRAAVPAFLYLLAVAPAAAAPAGGEGKWIPLFNGKDLTGWTAKVRGHRLGDNHADTFRVEDGLLKVSYDRYPQFAGKFGHLVYRRPFSHYRLRIEYRFVGQQVAGGPAWAYRNSGVMIHVQAPASMATDQEFPVSIEVQFLGGRDQGERPTANVCSPGTHIVKDGQLITQHCTNSRSKTHRGDQWVTVEVVVRGSELIEHIVDGETVLSYAQPQLDAGDPQAKKLLKPGRQILDRGYLYLQAESHPVEFRKVELQPLPPARRR